jgi:hypothetical protein
MRCRGLVASRDHPLQFDQALEREQDVTRDWLAGAVTAHAGLTDLERPLF